MMPLCMAYARRGESKQPTTMCNTAGGSSLWLHAPSLLEKIRPLPEELSKAGVYGSDDVRGCHAMHAVQQVEQT